MDDSSRICLACGLCCDGTLIGFVQLGRDELPALRELLDVEEEDGNGVLLHPCSRYCEGCTIYAQRPKQCAKFKCGLLNSVEQKELDFESAVETIEVVKQKKIAIEEKLAMLQLELESESFYFKMVELKKVLEKNKADSTATPNQLELMSDLNDLDSLLSEKFDLTMD